MKPNFKEAAKKYRRLYHKMRGYFIDVRDEFESTQVIANKYMRMYKDAVDENDRLKFKIAELKDELNKQKAAYNELYEYCSSGEGRKQQASEVAEEIFAEIEACIWSKMQYGDSTLCFEINSAKYEEIKKKYTEGEK